MEGHSTSRYPGSEGYDDASLTYGADVFARVKIIGGFQERRVCRRNGIDAHKETGTTGAVITFSEVR